jgi:cytochrome c5
MVKMNRYACLSVLILIIVFIGVSLANMQINNPGPDNNAITSDKESEITHTPVVTERVTDRGQLLYENHCTTCHESGVHLRQSGKVHSVNDIRQWVIRWSNNLELDWKNNDVDVVTDYLNRHFYQFNTEK